MLSVSVSQCSVFICARCVSLLLFAVYNRALACIDLDLICSGNSIHAPYVEYCICKSCVCVAFISYADTHTYIQEHSNDSDQMKRSVGVYRIQRT